jgi:hypothetical protein
VNGYHSNTQKKYANEEPGGSCLATTDTHQPDDFFIDFFQMPQICNPFNMVRIHDRCLTYTGCCPNKNSFERSLKRFLLINLGEAEDQRFELFEPEGRVFARSEAWRANRLERALDLSKNVLDQAKRDLGNSPYTTDPK